MDAIAASASFSTASPSRRNSAKTSSSSRFCRNALSSLRTTSALFSFFSVSWAAAASFQKSGAPARASSSAFSFSARRTSKVPP